MKGSQREGRINEEDIKLFVKNLLMADKTSEKSRNYKTGI